MAVKLDDRSRTSAPTAFASGTEGARSTDAAPRDRLATRPGDTLPPTPLAALLAAGGADLLVLSTDAQLIDTATRASREQLRIWSVASWPELETALAVTRRAVVLIDADLLGNAARARLAALDAYSHKVVTLVAADRSVAEGLMGLLSERKIHRLLIKPPALGITRLLIDSAVGRCLRLEVAEAPQAETVVEQPRAPVRRRRVAAPFWVFAAAGAALLAGVAVIAGVSAWWRSSPLEGAPLSGQAPVDVAIVDLGQRPVAGESSAVVDQPGTQDLDGYLAVLAADPTDAAARQQVDAIVAALYAEAETALLGNSYRTAETALADVRRADPTSSRLAFLEAQLERARQAPAARQAVEEPPAAATVTNTELASLVTIARARIQRSRLLDPAGDSALEYVARAERLAPQHADVAAVRSELAAALLAGAHGALAKADLSRASAFAREARRRGADAREVAQLESEVARLGAERAAERQAEWLALAETRLREGAFVEPADDNARHYLSTLQREAPEHAGLDAAWMVFVAAMQERIAAALAARDWQKAEDGLAALADAPNGASAGEPLRAQLATAKLEEHYLAVATPAGELELLERAPPVYPVEAARSGTEGWVEIEFVVDVTGQTRDLEVVAAEPRGEFEKAALAALAEYRYRPFARDGHLFARRVRLRIRFALE